MKILNKMRSGVQRWSHSCSHHHPYTMVPERDGSRWPTYLLVYVKSETPSLLQTLPFSPPPSTMPIQFFSNILMNLLQQFSWNTLPLWHPGLFQRLPTPPPFSSSFGQFCSMPKIIICCPFALKSKPVNNNKKQDPVYLSSPISDYFPSSGISHPALSH